MRNSDGRFAALIHHTVTPTKCSSRKGVANKRDPFSAGPPRAPSLQLFDGYGVVRSTRRCER